MKNKFLVIVFALFVVLSGIFYWLKGYAPEFNFNVLMAGNVIMAILSILSFFLVVKRLSGNSTAFLGGVYSSTFLKLFVCVSAIVGYAVINKETVHKPTLFILLGIYAVYSAAETILVSRIARGTK